MGMFDYIRCEVPLPDAWNQENNYVGLQTKEFDCEMVTHVITAEGRMMLDRGHWEEVPKAERPYPNDDGILGWAGSQRRIPKMEDANFHGFLHFGGLEVTGYEPDEKYGPKGRPILKDHSYRAKFTDGQLVGIEIDTD